MKILLLEDDTILAQTLCEILKKEGYSVDIASNYEEALDKTFEEEYDLYLFDINLPKESGLILAKELRESFNNTPVIFITALVDIDTMSQAFQIGAEDYIKKPFHPKEILLRIESKFHSNQKKIYYKNIEIDLKEQIIKKDGHIIYAGYNQFNILKELLLHQGTPVSKERLLELLETPSDIGLRVTLNKIKKKFQIEIKNIRGRGYLIE